jgi:hypothetical protein
VPGRPEGNRGSGARRRDAGDGARQYLRSDEPRATRHQTAERGACSFDCPLPDGWGSALRSHRLSSPIPQSRRDREECSTTIKPNLEKLKRDLESAPKIGGVSRRRAHRDRVLSAEEELGTSSAQKAQLRAQSTAGAKGTRYPPGGVVSVQLERCEHRARVEALASGLLPGRAKCPQCRLWRNTIPATARKPLRSATRTVVDESVEVRAGRTFVVKTLATPRRARFR